MPAYVGLLGSTGLAFLLHAAYLFPLTMFTLFLAVGVLGFRAGRRRGYGPFAVGVLASSLMLVGKFLAESAILTYGGIALLVAASVWNAWPIRTTNKDLIQLGFGSMVPENTKKT